MGKSLSSLSLVSLMALVNSGATTATICAEYGCTEPEFHARLKEICTRPGTIDGVLADIARNEEKAGAPAASGAVSPVETASGIGRSASATAPATPAKFSSPELDRLSGQQTELLEKIAALGNQSNELLNKHYANTKELREREVMLEAAQNTMESARAAFEAATEELEKQQKEYDECASTDKALAAEIASVKESQESTEKELEDVRAQIFDLTHATIQVLEDGTVTQTSGKTELVLIDDGSDALFAELSGKEEYQDLPIKKVRILARVLKIMEHSNLELEVNCDDPEINRFLHASL